MTPDPTHPPTILSRCIAVLEAQTQKGRAKYGGTLDEAKPGILALKQHLQQELADALQYVTAEIVEMEGRTIDVSALAERIATALYDERTICNVQVYGDGCCSRGRDTALMALVIKPVLEAALPAALPSRVKGLEWTGASPRWESGPYVIEEQRCGTFYAFTRSQQFPPPADHFYFNETRPTLEAAKSACQADHEARILAMMEPAPAAAPGAGMRRALEVAERRLEASSRLADLHREHYTLLAEAYAILSGKGSEEHRRDLVKRLRPKFEDPDEDREDPKIVGYPR